MLNTGYNEVDMQEKKQDIVILGPEKTGKTQLVNRLLNKEFESQYQSTIAIVPRKYKIPDSGTILYRDIAGDCDKPTITSRINNKSTNQIYLVFNAHKDDGLDKLKEYVADLGLFPETAKISLIGTHADEEITTSVQNAARLYAFDLGGDYYPISLQQDAHPNIQMLIKKSIGLLSVPIQRRSSVSGSSYNGDNATVIGLSSLSLQQHDQHYSTRAPSARGHDGTTFIQDFQQPTSVYPSAKQEEQTFASAQSQSPNRRRPRSATQHRDRTQAQSSVAHISTQPNPPAPANRFSFALRMAGMTMILAAVIGLIYIALVVVNILSAVALISMMNHIVVGVGSLLGASTSTSLMTISQVGASLNVSTTAVAGMFMTGPTAALLAVGFGLFRAGQKPEANTLNADTNSYQRR